MRIIATRIVRFDLDGPRRTRPEAPPPYKGNEKEYMAWYREQNREHLRALNNASAARRRQGK